MDLQDPLVLCESLKQHRKHLVPAAQKGLHPTVDVGG